ncbi:demethylmenaquinone methyltransferase [Ruminiclostridium hungatei]|uniref:Demethylmenaquinone methyltransferase n=1 Tax=Ruminiclostridium hungatei TaxID=48256 RepID=A0A1V4SEI1_RUMHU|nr:methyltransferase domain-containing protein [Ruminiclostridium hungatei]OPX41916.1 demethylmenaquinone methyltransferase [Ruminiclostridium hungatei]
MIRKAQLIFKFAYLRLAKKYANSAKDYDNASVDYDSFFSKTMGKYSLEMIDKIHFEKDQQILELACGTGFITENVAKKMQGQGAVTTVDQSAGMLELARRKLEGYENIKLDMRQGNMMQLLKSIPDNSFDNAVCGWAICYVNPVEFLKEIYRVLKPDGRIGIIETRSDSEQVLMEAFDEVLAKDPSLLERYIKIALPSNSDVLKNWFIKGGLQPVECWEGEEVLPYYDSEGAIEWVQRSGASAGFLDVINRDRLQEVLDKVKAIIDRDMDNGKNFKLSHTYVAGVARKQTGSGSV